MKWLAGAFLLPFAASAAEVNGYLDNRSQFTRARAEGLIPTDDQPQASELLEANLQLRHNFREQSFAYADLSLIAQWAGSYRGLDSAGHELALPAHDVKATHPLVSLNELYVSHELRPELNFLLGKKRIVWGSGMAFNPTDLLNPAKDPTDPNFQRAGAYLARIEVPLEKLAFTLVASPAVLKQESGLPYQFLSYPSWDLRDDALHFQLALRAYALVANSDVNLMLFYGNRYQDAFERKLRAGASFSRYFFTDYELHFEALFQSGSTRQYVNGECAADAVVAIGCVLAGTSPVEQRRLTENTLLPKILLGTRRQFPDESLVSIEYLYQADGYTRAQFQDFVNALELVKEARLAGVPLDRLTNPFFGGSSADGVPQKFAFEPLRRHYLFINYQRPKIHDDFTFSVVAVASLEDLSGFLAPSLSWSATEWMTLTLYGFVPFPGPNALAATPSSNALGKAQPVSEYTLAPLAYRGLFEVRLFY